MTAQTSDLSRHRSRHLALNSLGFMQVLLLTMTAQIGVGVYSLPRIVVEQAGHDGWMAPLLAGLATQIELLIIVALLRRFGNLDLYEILCLLFGRWLGRLIGFAFALYCVVAAALVSRTYVEMVQTWLFPTTSTRMFYLLLLLPCVYAATGGIRVIGRFATITFLATIWILLLVIVPAEQIQTDYYRPLFTASWIQHVQAAWHTSYSVTGFELLLLFYPFVQNKQRCLLAASIGIWGTTLMYTIACVVAIGFYSQSELSHILSPTLHMAQIIEIPLIERVEHVEIAIWAFLIVVTVAVYLWGAARFLHTLRRKKPIGESNSVYLFLPPMFMVGSWPQDFFALTRFEAIMGAIGSVIAFGMPPLLLLLALILRKKAAPPSRTDGIEEEVNA